MDGYLKGAGASKEFYVQRVPIGGLDEGKCNRPGNRVNRKPCGSQWAGASVVSMSSSTRLTLGTPSNHDAMIISS